MNQELHLPTSTAPAQHINTRTAWRPVLRPISAVVIAAQLALVLQPLSVLAQDKGQQSISPLAQNQLNRIHLMSRDIEAAQAKKQLDSASPADKASTELARIEEISKTLHADLRARGLATLPAKPTSTGQASDKDAKDIRAIGPNMRIETQRSPQQDAALRLQDSQRSQQLADLKDLLSRQSAAQGATRADFAATRLDLEQKKLPAEILARHDQAVAQFEQRAAQFNQIALKIQSNQPLAQQNSAQAAPEKIASSSAQPLDELNTFFAQYPSSKRAAPSFDPQNPKKLPWSTPEPTKRAPAETKTAWNHNLHKDYYAAQSVKLAQAGNIGNLQFTQLPEPGIAPSPADLAETAEVKLTPAIRAQATALGNNPVQIHNWVRNTVQWLPTWGSIQGADGTLKSQRGNSTDIASLEIALLRAAGIPARYQFGTIDIPVEQAMNWVGGVTQPEAAMQQLGQGGIANRGLIEGGRFAKVRMEHIWVNAYVNWAPSRGAKDGGASLTPKQHVNPNGQLNAWVPLDASFKQYSYTQGLDLKTQVPLDTNALFTAAQLGATSNVNYVQNLNQGALQTQLRSYQNQIQAYINSSPKGASATVGDVLGTQSIATQTYPLLAGTLPYPVISLGTEAADLPDSMRWKVAFQASELDPFGWQGAAVFDKTFNLSQLLFKRVGVTYEGASLADQQAITSYRTTGATSFPAYALNIKPQFQIDGASVATGVAIGMAHDLDWQVTVIPAGESVSTGKQQTYSTVAGDEMVWAVIGDAVSASQLQAMNFPSTAAGQLHAVGMSYWHQVDVYANLIAKREGAVAQRMPSMGSISSPLQVQFSWGVPRNAHYRGRMMDIAHSTVGIAGMDGATFQRALGMRLSYLEGYIFDQVFGREQGSGISAVRLMQTAIEAGQRVFTLNSSNAAQFLNQIEMTTRIRTDVSNALNAGMEVTIPEFNQTVSGWQGTAYIAVQPETGAGAYIISGNLRGGDEGADCQLQPSTSPATSASFSPAVLFVAAILAIILIAYLSPVLAAFAGIAAVSQTAAAAPPGPQLPSNLSTIWNRISGGSPWPTQFNWPPAFGAPPLLHGTCTAEQHATLEAAKAAACSLPSACLGTDSCTQIETKLQNRTACIDARLAVMDTCFMGGDAGHWGQIQQQLNGFNNCITCQAKKLAAQQCTGGN